MSRQAHLFIRAVLLLGCPACVLASRPLDQELKAASGKPTLRGNGGASDFPELSMSSLVQTRSKTRKVMSRDPEQLEAWEDKGQAVFAQSYPARDSALEEMMQSISTEAYAQELHELCDADSSRFVGTEGNIAMSQRILDKFNLMNLKTRIEDLEVTDGVSKYVQLNSAGKGLKYGGNVIGMLEGTDLKDQVVVVGAHYDSVNWEKKNGIKLAKAPGVDDNGSGLALVQLVARALTQSKIPPRRSIMFVAFNAEEEGLIGSDQMAEKAANGHYGKIHSVLIADEVAFPGAGKGDRKAIFETGLDAKGMAVDGTDILLDTFAHHAPGTGVSGFEVNHHGFGSDHMSFLKRRIPAMLLIERNNIAHAEKFGHSARDDFDHVDMDYGAAMTRLMLRVAHALGSPADQPANLPERLVSPHLVAKL